MGVDIAPQPRYAGDEFVQGDALDVLRALVGEKHDRHEEIGVFGLQVAGEGESFFAAGDGGPLDTVDTHHVGHTRDSPKPAFPVKDFDALHASPPCQAHTLMQAVARNQGAHPELIEPVRRLLRTTGLPYVIENVVGAPLENPHVLCGSMFGLSVVTEHGELELRRHRLFETNWPWLVPTCQHRRRVIGIYGDHARSDRRHGSQSQFPMSSGLEHSRVAMGMPWATWDELREAIPPAYTELIGHQLMQHVQAKAAA